jgi:hypothetical protein
MSPASEMILMRRPWLAQPGLFSHGFTKVGSVAGGTPDDEVADRLIAAYRRAIEHRRKAHVSADDVWTKIAEGCHGEMVRILVAGNARELLDNLSAMPRRAFGHGFLQGEATFKTLMGDPSAQRERALWLMDHLVGMAEAAGVLSVRCLEQGDFAAVPPNATADALRRAIERRLGISIALPALFDGLFALEPDKAILHLRSIMSAYAVWKAVTLAGDFLAQDGRGLKLAEIGAGVGFSAMAAYEHGVESYDIYDLPEINVAQGYLLLKCLPSGAVALFGEEFSPHAAARPRIRVLPAFALDEARADAFDITINMDSLPEIAHDQVMHYLLRLRSVSRLFLSINQETEAPQTAAKRQLVARQLVAEVGGFRGALRYPNWVRQGYVDELWLRE